MERQTCFAEKLSAWLCAVAFAELRVGVMQYGLNERSDRAFLLAQFSWRQRCDETSPIKQLNYANLFNEYLSKFVPSVCLPFHSQCFIKCLKIECSVTKVKLFDIHDKITSPKMGSFPFHCLKNF